MPRCPSRSSPRPAALVAVLAFAALAGGVAPAAGQERKIRFDRLTIKDGLSQSSVNCIFQDQYGFMWFGTQDGLNRFDGHRFDVLRHDPENPQSLSRNWVWSCLEDRRGFIWVGTGGGGLNRWDPQTRTFRHFRYDRANPTTLSNETVRVMLEDRRERLWIGTEGGLNLLDRTTWRFRRFNHNPSNPSSLSADNVRAMIEDSQGFLWIGTYGGGLSRLDPETETFSHFRHRPGDSTSLSEDRIRFLYEDSQANLWVGTYESGLNRFDRASGRFERFRHDPADTTSLSDNTVRWILEDSDGVLWVGTDGGLNEWTGRGAGFRSYHHSDADPSTLADDRVMSLFQDRGGVLWIGTRGGLNKWNPTTGSFVGFQRDQGLESTLSSNHVNGFAESSDGSLWIGTYDGLNRLDRSTGRIRQFLHRLEDAQGLPDNRVMSLFVDDQDTLWVGTFEDGLLRYDPATDTFQQFENHPGDPGSLSVNGVTSIYQDSRGTLWVGTYGGGVNRFVPETERFIRFRSDSKNPNSLSNDQVLALREDSLGILWIGTDGGGLNGFDRSSGSFFSIQGADDEPGALGSDVVWAIHEDPQGDLWLGTRDGGLVRWRLEDRREHRSRFRVYTKRDGLPNDTVYGIQPDDDGKLWLSTNDGLSRFDPATETFKNFDDTHGLLSKEFNFGAHFRASTGELMFGGNHGFNIFYPDRIRSNTHRPPVVLSSFLILNQEVETEGPLAELRQIELDHSDSVVTFEFAALDYTAPAKNQYAYKLEGFDDEWVEQGSIRRVTYTNLDAGEYTLRVRASNNDNLWNEEGLSIKLRTVPPPWRSWWAWCLYALACGGGLVAYTRAQALKLEREAEYSRKLEREVQARTRELADRNEELEHLNRRLKQASVTDSLTGLRNRRYLVGHIESDIALVDRDHPPVVGPHPLDQPAKRTCYLFLIVDIDGFKQVNDTYGHAAGDRVLVQICEILKSACRKSDTLIRWGGDEFLVVGRNADPAAVDRLAGRIRKKVAQHPFDLGGGQTVHLTSSIGFAQYPFLSAAPQRLNWEQVLLIADRALYIAKKSGRDAWVGLEETPRAAELPAGELISLVHERIDELISDGRISVRSSIGDDRKLVWAWG